MSIGLLDVNALVALAWDSHVHHVPIRKWFAAARDSGWATCPLTESGFVRVSANPKVLPAAISVEAARRVLGALRRVGSHRFLGDDVSMVAADVPELAGHRQVTDAHLLTLARRNRVRLITFDSGVASLASEGEIELLSTT